MEIPLVSKTLNGAIAEVERGGKKFCAEQTFDVCLFDVETNAPGEMLAEMVVAEWSWLEAWGDPDDVAEDYRV